MAAAQASSSRPKPPVVQPSSGNAIIINPCQRLNPVLECIRNVNKEFGDIIPDFQLGRTTCALYISLKYHRLHPEYIHQRIERLGHAYNLRILLLLCDISEHQEPIRELTKICLINNVTIVVAWSFEEAGAYLATYKAFEHKSPDLIKERVDNDYNSILKSALMSIGRVNKTDVETLKTSLGSFASIVKAPPERLQQLPGFGQVKVRRLKDAFEKPFRNNSTSSIASMAAESASRAQTQNVVASDGTVTEDSRPAAPNQTQTSSQPTASSSLLGKRKDPFGSAADMLMARRPPHPSPPAASTHARDREPSPPWDIELDLNDDEVEFALFEAERQHANALQREKSQSQSRNEHPAVPEPDPQADLEKMPPPPPPPRRQRSPSPVWDIELDLNDDI